MKIEPKVLREDATQKIVQLRTPLGVVAAITPWNFPMILLHDQARAGAARRATRSSPSRRRPRR